VQLALPTLLSLRPRVQEPILQRVRANHQALREALEGSLANVLKLEGGWYAVVRMPALQSDEQFCIDLLEQASVVTQPGYFFDLPGTHLVLSLIVEPRTFEAGVRGLRQLLDRIA
jgi:alanine-synthesizing transaminase